MTSASFIPPPGVEAPTAVTTPTVRRSSISRGLLLPVVAALLSLAACQRAAPVREESPRPVRVVTVTEQRAAIALTLPAEVRPRVETRYGFRIAGKIAARAVEVGDSVQPGQLLARLDPQDREPARAAARSQLDAAQTEARLAGVELERVRELHAQRYVSRAQLDRQQAAADAANARVRAARAGQAQADNELAFQTLRAEVAGVVTAVQAEVGQVVAAGQPVVRVARAGEFELLAHVPERELASARAASAWSVSIPALDSERRQAVLRELSPLADPASRTYAMRLTLGDPATAAGLALGMSAVVQAVREAQPAFEVPLSALYSRDGNPHVWRVGDGDRVELVAVRTAGLLDDAVRIVDGLASGDRVVTAGASLLVAGQRVRPLEAGAAPEAQAMR
ncbi:MAG: efflux RND transporter periplasmic adaptor subunit [Burkholderiaceae bacterium]|nr:efflux RND transporter periplasmic adaptor subunit [Burkholderiaceae bacterium]